METKPQDMNLGSKGENLHAEYRKYVEVCKSLGKEPRTWHEWYYGTYSAFEESWRLTH